MKCLLAVLMCLVLSVPSFAESTKSAFQRVNNGSWTAYNIGRDYLGNITHIATTSGTLVAEYSYDPWGRLRSPATHSIYTPGNEPTLFLGRGFTGHEHLTWFGLINMNARLYDPLVGRFLSPDPYVQAPDFTQNFNRYSYALNNPLRYTDESGKIVGIDDAFWIALICAGVSMVVDYGIQVFCNYQESKTNPNITTKDIFLNKIDWFDIGLSGLVSGFTGWAGAAANSGKELSKFWMFWLKHQKLIKGTEILASSAIDITGEGWQDVSFEKFIQRSVTGIITYEVTDQITKQISNNLNVDENTEIPKQKHHFATNKNKAYTPQMLEIAQKYGLDLDGDWNKEVMEHLGRHPNEYHDFVLEMMRQIDYEAAGDQQRFLELFDTYVKQVIIRNPGLLRKSGWRF